MKHPPKLITWSCLLILSLTLIPITASSQSVWLDPTVKSSVSLEILKPDYWIRGWSGGGQGVLEKSLSAALIFSCRARVSSNLFLLLELPTSHYDAVFRLCPSYDFDHCYESDVGGESLIGNPLFGIEATSSSSPFYTQIGIRLPLTGEGKTASRTQGVVAAPNRLGAFLHDVLTVRLRAGVRTEAEAGLAYHIFLGPSYLKPVGDISAADSDVILDYGSQLWLVTERARLGAGLIGQLLATSNGDGLGESSLHQFGVAANFLSGRFRPGARLSVPLDDDMPGLQFVWGLTLQIKLGNN